MKLLAAILLISTQLVPADDNFLSRRYREGEKLTYRMQAVNEGLRYQIQADGVVRKDSTGRFLEEYAWSNLTVDGKAFTLPPESVSFRQLLTLASERQLGMPDLGRVHPLMIGPITDFMTFYVDLWLAIRVGSLARAGDHHYHKHGKPASWADGTRVLIGEDSIDFAMTLTDVNQSDKVATLLVRHVPPKQPEIKLPAGWMRDPVADTPNNWVQVEKKGDQYVAAVGKETFDVQLKVSLADGKMLSGAIDNPVATRERECADRALASCGEARSHRIRRQVEIQLET